MRFSHVPILIPRFVQCVTGLLRLLLARSWLVLFVTGLLLACSWLVPLVTGPFLACSACYWLVPLVLCFSNVDEFKRSRFGVYLKAEVSSVLEGVVAPWSNFLTLQPEQSGRVGLNPGRALPLERHDKGVMDSIRPLYFCNPSAWH